jgi:photosystem II stability/assembly factor-like uncharacterized protein
MGMRAGLWRVYMAGLAVLLLALAGCGAAPQNEWLNIGPGSAQINTLSSDPHIRGIIVAGGSDGTTYVARGDIAGIFVKSDKSPGTGPVNIIFPNPYTNGAVYAGTAGGFYASSDYGVRFTAQNSGLPSGANVTAITSGADATTLFASIEKKGLFTSADGGKTWKAVPPATTTMALPSSATVESLLWDGAARALYAAISGADGNSGIYISRDSGANWSASNDGLPTKTDVYALLEMPSGGVNPSGPTLYAGTSAGVFAFTSGTSKWQPVGVGLPPGPAYSLATYYATPGLLYAGTANTVYFSTDGGQHWKLVAAGLAHAVPAIVVTPGKDTPTVTFVASGQIARYPAGNAASGGILSSLLLVVIIGSAAWYILARYRIVPSIKDVRRRLSRKPSS